MNVTRGFATDNVCAGNTGTIPRLGWPGLCLHDAGNGVRATDLVNSYPSALHVGASWDKNLTYQRGYYMGKEFKTKGGESRTDRNVICNTDPLSSQCPPRTQRRPSRQNTTWRS